MTEIIPKYEVLYSDLRSHYIGTFLASREFKLFMTENGYFEQWKELFEQVKSNRGYIALGADHEPGDASDTFAVYLNAIPENKNVENLVSIIISKFIENEKKKQIFQTYFRV